MEIPYNFGEITRSREATRELKDDVEKYAISKLGIVKLIPDEDDQKVLLQADYIVRSTTRNV